MGKPCYLDFTLTNTGQWPLEYEFDSGSDPAYIVLSGSNVSGVLEAGQSAVIGVSFRAGTDCEVGTISTVFAMQSNDNTPAEEVAASLTVIDAQHIDLDYDGTMEIYINWPRGLTQNIDLTNVGCDDLTVTSISVTGPYFTYGSVETGVFAPGAVSSFWVNFHPTEVGTYYGVLRIESDDPDQPVIEFAIVGEAIEFGGPEQAEPGDMDRKMTAHPNPFNPSTTISFYTPQAGNADVRIYNLRGQLVQRLDAGTMSVGRGSVQWNGKDRRGSAVASGVYFYRLHIDGRQVGETGRAMLLK